MNDDKIEVINITKRTIGIRINDEVMFAYNRESKRIRIARLHETKDPSYTEIYDSNKKK